MEVAVRQRLVERRAAAVDICRIPQEEGLCTKSINFEQGVGGYFDASESRPCTCIESETICDVRPL